MVLVNVRHCQMYRLKSEIQHGGSQTVSTYNPVYAQHSNEIPTAIPKLPRSDDMAEPKKIRFDLKISGKLKMAAINW